MQRPEILRLQDMENFSLSPENVKRSLSSHVSPEELLFEEGTEYDAGLVGREAPADRENLFKSIADDFQGG